MCMQVTNQRRNLNKWEAQEKCNKCRCFPSTELHCVMQLPSSRTLCVNIQRSPVDSDLMLRSQVAGDLAQRLLNWIVFQYPETNVTSAFRFMRATSMGSEIVVAHYMTVMLVHYKQKSSSSTGDQECHCRMQTQLQKQSVDNYIDRNIIAGLQCINPSLQRQMHIWHVSGAKTIEMRKK